MAQTPWSIDCITYTVLNARSFGAEKFQRAFNILEHAWENEIRFSDLPSDIKDIYGFLAKVDKNGIVIGIENCQVHHILPKSVKKFREFFAKAGLSIDDNINKKNLPDQLGKDLYKITESIHSGKNTETYYKEALEKVQQYLQKGKNEGWSQAQYREVLEPIVNKLREGVSNGTIDLNAAKTMFEKYGR